MKWLFGWRTFRRASLAHRNVNLKSEMTTLTKKNQKTITFHFSVYVIHTCARCTSRLAAKICGTQIQMTCNLLWVESSQVCTRNCAQVVSQDRDLQRLGFALSDLFPTLVKVISSGTWSSFIKSQPQRPWMNPEWAAIHSSICLHFIFSILNQTGNFS